MLLFAGFHLVLGGGLFAFVVWFLVNGDDVDGGEDDGGTRVRRPRRPKPRPSHAGPARHARQPVPRPRGRDRSVR